MPPIRLSALLASATLLTTATAFAQEPVTARTVIVMDGSGSMWGQIDGTPKLEIARETVGEVLADLPAEREVGLIAYGHRTRGDCSDIEVMVQPAANTAAAILGAVNAMRFQGRTPLSAAVRMAAEELRFTEDPATVVLVTDGLETCEADPCALGRELEAAGVDFTAHVVGFGLTEEEGAQVSCLAQNTGGRYFEASDRAALTDALDSTLVAVADPAPAPEPSPEPETPLATLEAPDEAPLMSFIEVTWTGPGHEDDYIEIVHDREIPGRWVSWAPLGAPGEPVTIRMPPGAGDYLIRYQSGGTLDGAIAAIPITATDAQFVLDGPAAARPGELISVFWIGPNGEDDYIDIQDLDEAERTSGEPTWAWARDGNPAEFHAPPIPGDYVLRYIVQGENSRAVGLSIPFEVLPDAAQIVAPPAVQPGARFTARAVGPLNGNFWLDLVEVGHEGFRGEISYFYLNGDNSSGMKEGQLTAPETPGTYELRYVIADNRLNYRVSAVDTIEVSASAPADPVLPPYGGAPAPQAPAEPPAPAAAEDADQEDAALGEDVGLVCEGSEPCTLTDAATGLTVTLPGGWRSDFPTAAPEGTRVSFFAADASETITLNAIAPQGRCRETAKGALCGPDLTSPAFQTIRQSLGTPGKDAATAPSDPVQTVLDGVLGGMAAENPEGAAMLREMLGDVSLEEMVQMGQGALQPAPVDESAVEAPENAIPIPLNGRDPEALLRQLQGQ